MDRTRALAAGAGGVVVVALLVALIAPGALSAPRSASQPGHVDIADATIQPQAVGGETVALRVNTTPARTSAFACKLSTRSQGCWRRLER